MPSASASRDLLVGIYDEPSTIGRPDWAFPKYKALRVKVLRVNLYWGDVLGVAKNRRPAQPTQSGRSGLRLVGLRPRRSTQAKANGIQMVFSILWTPRWAGPQEERRADAAWSTCATSPYAAAKRYSGSYVPIPDAEPLPSVRYWLAWNEPNNPVFLSPQFRRVGSRYVVDSPRIYSQMCNAIYSGVKTVRVRQQGRLRRHRSARQQQRPQLAALALPDLLRQGHEALAGAVRRLRASPVLRPPARDTDVPPDVKRVDGGAAREHQRPRRSDRSATSASGSPSTGTRRRPTGSSGSRSQRRRATSRSRSRSRGAHPRIDMMLWFLLRRRSTDRKRLAVRLLPVQQLEEAELHGVPARQKVTR